MRTTFSLLNLLAVATLSLSAAEGPPNIVYIIADDQSWTDFGFMGNPRVHTPNLDALAARSARFPNGYVPASVCRPSLVTLLTGLYPHQHGVHFNHGPPGNAGYNAMTSREEYERVRDREFAFIQAGPTLPGMLAGKHGYRCLQTGKFWEGHWRNGGFTEGMTTFAAPPPEVAAFGGRRVLASGEEVAHGNGDAGLAIGRLTMQPIIDFIGECERDGTPWMVWYAAYLPHQPHDSPERFYELARARPGVEEHELPYFASIAQFDSTVGELVRTVDSAGANADTLFVFVVDNGWSPSTRRRSSRPAEFVHTAESKRAPFDMGLRTPILLAWDGVITPATHEGLVSSVDLFPTLLAAAGDDFTPRAGHHPGANLLPVARGEENLDLDRAVFGAIYPGDATGRSDPARDLAYRWVRRGKFKLIVPEGEAPWGGYLEGPALYDLAADPHEQINLADDPDQTETITDLRARLDAWWDPGRR